jgi:hypothetical protein
VFKNKKGYFMKKGVTQRGFVYYEFKDLQNKDCTIQESSLAMISAIWLGYGNNRMELDRKMTFKILLQLIKFVIFGRL